MTKFKATVVGFLVAPLFPAVVMASSNVDFNSLDSIADFGWALAWVLVAYIIVLVATFCIAGPLFLMLKRFNFINFGTSTLSGLVVGILVELVLRGFDDFMLFPDEVIRLATLGAFSALIFWIIWRQGQV